jgi:AcrR family transcriptional regulator
VSASAATRNVGGRPPRSSREAVVDAGLALLKSEGLEAVTLAAVGARLGLGKAAMYTYVASKDDLLVAMRDEVLRRELVALRAEDHLAPEVAMKASCTRLAGAMRDYGPLMVGLQGDLREGPALDVSEHFLTLLERLGLAPRQQFQVYALLAGFLESFVAGQSRAGAAPEAVTEALADPARFPRLRVLFQEALTEENATPDGLVDDVLSMLIDVLVPALRA